MTESGNGANTREVGLPLMAPRPPSPIQQPPPLTRKPQEHSVERRQFAVSPATSLFVGSFSSSAVTGTMNVTRGTFTVGNNSAIYIGRGGYNGAVSGTGVMNVSNGTFSTGTTTGTFRMGSNSANQSGNGEIDLSGTGTIETARPITKGTRGTATVNFDGGIHRLRGVLPTPAQPSTAGHSEAMALSVVRSPSIPLESFHKEPPLGC